MDYKADFKDLSKPGDTAKLSSVLAELAEGLDVLYTETAPNGNISARIGRIALYKNGSTYERWQNIDGGTTWQSMDTTLPFKAGDWIISSVTTARTGWTNVSATYSNKFIRINATPLTTDGADTHSHTLAEANLPSHTHGVGTLAAANESAHTHTMPFGSYGASPGAGIGNQYTPPLSTTTSAGSPHTHTLSGSTASAGSGTAFTGNNVPAYVQAVIFQKD